VKHQKLWMGVSGLTGFSFFLIANLTNLFAGSSVIAGVIQLAVNAFVFVVWYKAFTNSSGFQRFVAFWGVLVPLFMAAITVYRVLLPFTGLVSH